MPQAQGDSLLFTENHGTMIRKASEEAAFVRTVEIRHHQWIWDGWKQFYALMQRTLSTKTRSSWSSCQGQTSDCNWSIQICGNFFVGSTNAVTTTRNSEVSDAYIERNGMYMHDIFFFFGTGIVRYEASTKPKLTSIGCSRRVWKLIPAKSVHQKGIVNSCTSTHTWRWPCYMEVVMKLTRAIRWDHVLTNMPSARQTQYWDNEKWIDARGRSSDKPRMDNFEDPKRNDHLHLCRRKTQSWCQKQSYCIFVEEDTAEIGKNTFSKDSFSNKMNLRNLRNLLMGRRSNSLHSQRWIRKIHHQDSGRLNGQDQFMNRQWYCRNNAIRPDHDYMLYFNPRRTQDANCVFHQREGDIMTMSCPQVTRPFFSRDFGAYDEWTDGACSIHYD